MATGNLTGLQTMPTAYGLQQTNYWSGANMPTQTMVYQTQNIQVWQMWNNQIYSTTVTIPESNLQAQDGMYVVTTEQVWISWNQQVIAGNITINPSQQTQEENEAQREAWRVSEEKRKAASVRARKALLDVLAPPQREQFEYNGSFELEVNNRLYRVRPGQRVERLNRNTKRVESYFCIHPYESLPAEDIAISQKLLLEADEAEFLRLANETRAA